MKNYSLAEQIINKAFYIAVWFINKVQPSKHLQAKAVALDQLPEGSLGKAIAQSLKTNKLHFVPKFESHDLKHTLLGFDMTPLDEIRLQAFMLGNGNWTIPSIAIFIFGAILLPSKWNLFLRDYKAGKQAIPIKDWSIEDYAERDLEELRAYVFSPQ